MAGYKHRTVRLDFPELGDGCFVEIKNPLIQPEDRLTVADDLEGDELRKAANEVRARLIVDWCVWDPDTDEPLPVPKDAAVLLKVPRIIKTAIQSEINKAFPQ